MSDALTYAAFDKCHDCAALLVAGLTAQVRETVIEEAVARLPGAVNGAVPRHVVIDGHEIRRDLLRAALLEEP